jgi:hypothetical protein
VELDIREDTSLTFEVAGKSHTLPLKFSATLPKGIAALPRGLTGIPYVDLPAWALVKDDHTAQWATVNTNSKTNH